MSSSPVKFNAPTISLLAIISALGIVARMFIRITIIPDVLEITPGFLFSQLGGIIAGLPGGILVGAIVGMSGAISGGEFPLLPLIGNISLGVGTGWVFHVIKNRESKLYYLLVILGGGLIGGFIPSLIIVALTGSLEAAIIAAVIDCLQACLWAAVALFVNKVIVLPLAGHYLYPSEDVYQLDELEEVIE
jgi:hypothetical protein